MPWHLAVVLLTVLFLVSGIIKGIEKVNKVMMPAFFLLFIVIAVRVGFLDGASEGYKYLFIPQWEALLNPTTWVMAMGQAFFSLSITGSGMIIYGSYLSKTEDIPHASALTALLDTAAALVAGMAVIPAVFAFGLDPQAGPPLIFITLPKVFAQMPAGRLFAVLFFLSVLFAGVTSLINMLEVCSEAVQRQFGLGRTPAVLLTGAAVFAVGLFIEYEPYTGSWMDVITIYIVPGRRGARRGDDLLGARPARHQKGADHRQEKTARARLRLPRQIRLRLPRRRGGGARRRLRRHRMTRLAAVACEVFRRELSAAAEKSPNAVELHWLPQGLHDTPDELRRPPYGNPHGDRARRRAGSARWAARRDCALLRAVRRRACGGARREAAPRAAPHRRLHRRPDRLPAALPRLLPQPGRHLLVHARLARLCEDPLPHLVRREAAEYAERYGADNAAWLLEQENAWISAYDTCIYIDPPACPSPAHAAARGRPAVEYGWRFEAVPGGAGLLDALLAGAWDETRFLLCPPGRAVAPSWQEDIVKAE